MIRFDSVSKTYSGQFDALKQISLEIDSGEFIFLTGHSGAGKSTFLRLIALVESPSKGQILVDGRNLVRMQANEAAGYRSQVGFIFQDHRLLSDRSIFDNVALPLAIAGLGLGEAKKRVRAALDKVGLLNKEKLHPDALSSGEQQRVGIARAVVNRPKILLADEPTGNLDPNLSVEIIKLFGQFNDIGVTVLLATHDINLLGQQKHRRIALARGKVVAVG